MSKWVCFGAFDNLSFPPSFRASVSNLERFKFVYGGVVCFFVALVAFLVNTNALFPVLSAVLVFPALHLRSSSGLSRSLFVKLMIPHAVVLGFLGGSVVNWAATGATMLSCLHAACLRPGKTKEEMLEAGEIATKGGETNALEEFRQHSQSVKQKYGL
jgi:hypothetical protein